MCAEENRQRESNRDEFLFSTLNDLIKHAEKQTVAYNTINLTIFTSLLPILAFLQYAQSNPWMIAAFLASVFAIGTLCIGNMIKLGIKQYSWTQELLRIEKVLFNKPNTEGPYTIQSKSFNNIGIVDKYLVGNVHVKNAKAIWLTFIIIVTIIVIVATIH